MASMQVRMKKDVKGFYTKVIIPKDTVLDVRENHVTKFLVEFKNKYWFVDTHQASKI